MVRQRPRCINVCVIRNRYGHELSDEAKQMVQEFGEERKRQLDAKPQRGLRGPVTGAGWQCPNCGGAHGPHVATCPEPPRNGSLRERVKSAGS